MQALWSRAAQTRSSCHCNACLHAGSVIARRTTTAASRRRLRVGDLFTASFGTILGTAALVDAKVKEERRKQWDQAIAEAKAEMPIGDSEGTVRTIPDQHPVQYLPISVRRITAHQELPVRPRGTEDDCQTTLDQHLDETLEYTRQTADTYAGLESPETDEGWPEEPEEIDPNFPPRDPVRRIHVDKMEGMVSRLVARLLIQSREASRPSFSNPELSRQMKDIATRLGSLQGADTRLPAYTFHDPKAATKERRQLNNAIEALFKQMAADCSNINVIIAKICYNLLVSSSPPSIKTYDILISSLDRLKFYDLSQIVVHSFLFESMFTPTSTTVQLILDHYSVQKDESGFRATVSRISARRGDMRIKRRPIEELHRAKTQEWIRTKPVVVGLYNIRERVSRDEGIFDSLIHGFLDLDLHVHAVRYLRAALSAGIHLSSETLCRVVMTCARFLDYERGLSVLTAILGQWEAECALTVVYSKQTRFAIQRLFSLCCIDTPLKPTSSFPYRHRVSRAAVMTLQRHMAITHLDEKLQAFAKRMASMEAMLDLAAGTFGVTRVGHMEKAIDILNITAKIERSHERRKKRNVKKGAALMCAEVTTPEEWLATQYEMLSNKFKRQYDILFSLFPRLGWAERLTIISYYQRGHCLPSMENRFFKLMLSAKVMRLDTWWLDSPSRPKTAVAEDKVPVQDVLWKPPWAPSAFKQSPRGLASEIQRCFTANAF